MALPKKDKEEISESNSGVTESAYSIITPEKSDTTISQSTPEVIIDKQEPVSQKSESEVEFLQRILNHQHTGGFGRHLDEMINERIKSLI